MFCLLLHYHLKVQKYLPNTYSIILNYPLHLTALFLHFQGIRMLFSQFIKLYFKKSASLSKTGSLKRTSTDQSFITIFKHNT